MQLGIVGQAAQEAFGRRISGCIASPCVVYLAGDLGTGKTTLVRGILRGLGHQGPVRSPTYTLIEPYLLAGKHLYHLDLYRLGDPEELEFLGMRDLLTPDSILFVEWPERGLGVLPKADLEIRLAHDPPGRSLDLRAPGETGTRVLSSLARPAT